MEAFDAVMAASLGQQQGLQRRYYSIKMEGKGRLIPSIYLPSCEGAQLLICLLEAADLEPFAISTTRLREVGVIHRSRMPATFAQPYF